MSRAKALTMMAAYIAAVSLTTANAQDGAPRSCQASRAPVLCATQTLRKRVWRLQDEMSLPRTETNYSDRRDHASSAYREWVNRLWKTRLENLQARYAEWKRTEGDLRAYIDRAWPYYRNWLNIARCETGIRWDWNSGTYQGGLGFYRGSWDQFRPAGYPTEAYLATPLQQMWVGELIFQRYGLSGWGCREYA